MFTGASVLKRIWVISILLISALMGTSIGYYIWKTLTIPLEVKEPLQVLNYPSGLSLYPGERIDFNVTIQNAASVNYTVFLDFRLNDTEYQSNYIRFSNDFYTVTPGQQNLLAWLSIEPDAPPGNVSLFIDLKRMGETSFFDDFDSNTLDNNWTIIDPNGDSTFSLTSKPGYLTISTSSPPDRDLWPPVNLYSPRIMRPVSGNFTIETKVWAVFNTSIQSAGIFVWKDQDNYLRLERAYRYGYQEVIFSALINGVSTMTGPESTSGGALLHVPNINPIYFRLVKTGPTYSGYYSAEGVNWIFLANISLQIDYQVNAGLYNVNRGPIEFESTAFAASFDYFRVFAED